MPLIAHMATERRIVEMGRIAEEVKEIVDEAGRPLPFDVVIHQTASSLLIPTSEVHYGLNFGRRNGMYDFDDTHGTVIPRQR